MTTDEFVWLNWCLGDLFRLVDLYAAHSADETAAALDRPVSEIRAAASHFRLVKSPQQGRPWTEADTERLKELYPNGPTKEVARALNRGLGPVYRRAQILGLKKSAAFLASEESGQMIKGTMRGAACRFRRGHQPHNKGLRRPGWYLGRMRETQFKKGQKSWRAFPVGHVGPDPDGFLRIKVREPLYAGEPYYLYRPLYSHYVWEQHHGPVPSKHLVAYKDGNRANCAIENLELRSMADNARRNQMWNSLPPELAHAIALNGALKKKLRRAGAQKE